MYQLHVPQVAAGMKADIKVEIFAMAIGAPSTNGVGTVEHLLEITSETSILHLPIQASILTRSSYIMYQGRTLLLVKLVGISLTSAIPIGTLIILTVLLECFRVFYIIPTFTNLQ